MPPTHLLSEKISSQGQRSTSGGEVGPWVARFGGPPCRSVGRASKAPSTGCCTTRDGGGTQRGDRQVVSSGRRAPAGTCARGGGQSLVRRLIQAPVHNEWAAPVSVLDALEADLTPPPSTPPASVGAVMRRMQEIPLISLADSEKDTISTGPHDGGPVV